jgi:deaminated glutathione amidase
MSYGHSMIVGPWGDVLAEVKGEAEEGGEPEIAVAEIDLGVLERVRREVPLLRRT